MQRAIHSRFFSRIYGLPKQRDNFRCVIIRIYGIYLAVCVCAFKHFIKCAVKPIHRLRGWDVRHKGFNLVIICIDGWFQAMLHLLNRRSTHPTKTISDTNIAYEA